jgi:NadR type nicotinamide-nucleotide adenylyltransferase
MLKKIVAIGPESTGKSTLCKQLAAHYQCSWVPEYARAYLEEKGTDYTYEDLFTIATEQLKTEDQLYAEAVARNDQYLFIDTDMYVMKVWSEFVFNKCDNRILSQIANRHYDLYLLCDVDLPWQQDALREYPEIEKRKVLFDYYHDAMINQPVPWTIIQGTDEQRLANAVKTIDNLFN